MATDKQISANRANAAKSTGPKTMEGKETSSRNATKHGLTSRQVIIAGEDECAYETLVTGLEAQYQPEGALQKQLVRQLADSLWRLQRVPTLETLVLDTARYGQSPDVVGAADHHKSLRTFVIPNDVLGKLARHEAQLLKQMQCILELLGSPKGSAPSNPHDACTVGEQTAPEPEAKPPCDGLLGGVDKTRPIPGPLEMQSEPSRNETAHRDVPNELAKLTGLQLGTQHRDVPKNNAHAEIAQAWQQSLHHPLRQTADGIVLAHQTG